MNRIIYTWIGLFLLTMTALSVTGPAQARLEQIAAIVNNEAVSASDIAERTKLMIMSSGLPDSKEIHQKMKPQVANTLIDEALMLQEAGRLQIPVTPEDIDRGFESLAQQNKMTGEQFASVLKQQGISISSLRDQIRAQIAWSLVIQERLRPQIAITSRDIDALLDRFQSSIGKNQYLVSEIFLAVDSPAQEQDVKQLAHKLTGQMSGGKVPFPRLARQFSQAAGATKGGDMGWVQEGALPEELDDMLSRMKEGDLSQPVRSLSGYHILYLRKKRTLTPETLPSRDDLANKIGSEQLERLQRRYLLDLRTSAFIERRGV